MTPAAGRGERSRSGASPSPAGGASPRGGGISAGHGPFWTGCTDGCLKYGKCETVCPQHLPIRKPLEDVAKGFETA